MYQKYTFGFITQNFDDDGKCIDQWFTGENVEYEKDNEIIGEDELPCELRHPINGVIRIGNEVSGL